MERNAYEQIIKNILTEGLGFQAVADILKGMEIYQLNMKTAIAEMKAEKKAVYKICKSDQSARKKLDAVMTLWADMKGENNGK